MHALLLAILVPVLSSPFFASAAKPMAKPTADAAAAAKPSPVASPGTVTTPEAGTAGSTVPAPNGLEITWHGQSCFMMRTPAGTTVLMDPVAYEIGYKPPTVKADLVTISHEHPDHNNLKMVEVSGAAAGGAEVVRGLDAKGGWAEVDLSVGDVHVTTVKSFHDEVKGKKYGKNAVFVFDVAGRRVAHLGDLGQQLDAEQITALGKIDVLMIPIGGHYTVDGAGAKKIIAAVKPRYVIFPMHYKTPSLKIKELAGPETFLEGRTNVVRVDGNTYTVADTKGGAQPTEPVIVLLKAE